MRNYRQIGTLKHGEAVFFSVRDGVCVERDYHHLVEPTPKEMEEIKFMSPYLCEEEEDKKEAES